MTNREWNICSDREQSATERSRRDRRRNGRGTPEQGILYSLFSILLVRWRISGVPEVRATGLLVPLPAIVQHFFEDLRRRRGVRMALLRQALGELVDDVDGLLVRDLRAAGHQVVLPARDAGLAVRARIRADHEVLPLVLLRSHVLF